MDNRPSLTLPQVKAMILSNEIKGFKTEDTRAYADGFGGLYFFCSLKLHNGDTKPFIMVYNKGSK